MSNLRFIVSLIIGLLVVSLLTYVLIETGIDWSCAVFYNNNELYVYLASPFVLLGMFVPIIIIGYYLYQWRLMKQERFQVQFKRSLYSFIFSYIFMTALKVFTNRVDMEPFEPIGTVDTSDEFRFGFMNSNSWWESFSEGWPSGHTMIAVGMAITIHPLIKSKFWRSTNIIYPILVAWSVSTAFHWLSDVIAGGVIGIIVGLYFARKYSNSSLST
jgi:membrane-associated phospholipid phosphatase